MIKRNALVPYTANQMYELVNSIEEYPRFLPWCRESHIINKSDSEMEAKLDIVWSGMHKNFTTRNKLVPNELIEMNLVEGPFRHLEGKWSFTSLGEFGCKIKFELEFELAGQVLDKIFQPIFTHIANSLVDAFCKRAIEIYGKRELH